MVAAAASPSTRVGRKPGRTVGLDTPGARQHGAKALRTHDRLGVSGYRASTTWTSHCVRSQWAVGSSRIRAPRTLARCFGLLGLITINGVQPHRQPRSKMRAILFPQFSINLIPSLCHRKHGLWAALKGLEGESGSGPDRPLYWKNAFTVEGKLPQ